MSSGDNNNLDRILGGPVSDEIVVITESPQLKPGCSQNVLGVVLAPTVNAGSTAELPPREGRTGELQGGGPCQGPCVPLTDELVYLFYIHSSVTWVTLASSLHPQKLHPRKLSIDAISPKTWKFNTTKICTLTICTLRTWGLLALQPCLSPSPACKWDPCLFIQIWLLFKNIRYPHLIEMDVHGRCMGQVCIFTCMWLHLMLCILLAPPLVYLNYQIHVVVQYVTNVTKSWTALAFQNLYHILLYVL